MYSRVLRLSMALASQITLGSCSTYGAAASGISPDEMRVLVAGYYWHTDAQLPTYTHEQLDQLLRRSDDPTLDGEYAEAQASRLAVALAAVGDEQFAAALSHQPARVQRSVAFFISALWTHYGLHYPRTEVVCQKYI
jgi:hypothetical protein